MKSFDKISRVVTVGLYAAAALFWLSGWTIDAIDSRIRDNATAMMQDQEREADETRAASESFLATKNR